MDNEMLVKGFHALYKLVDEFTDWFAMLADADLNEDTDTKDKAMSLMSLNMLISIYLLIALKDTYKAVCAALELEEESTDGQLDR